MPVGSSWEYDSQRMGMAASNSEILEIVEGLSAEQKQISPKYFYDERGSQLFDQITQLPEYYLTNTNFASCATTSKTLSRWLANRPA